MRVGGRGRHDVRARGPAEIPWRVRHHACTQAEDTEACAAGEGAVRSHRGHDLGAIRIRQLNGMVERRRNTLADVTTFLAEWRRGLEELSVGETNFMPSGLSAGGATDFSCVHVTSRRSGGEAGGQPSAPSSATYKKPLSMRRTLGSPPADAVNWRHSKRWPVLCSAAARCRQKRAGSRSARGVSMRLHLSLAFVRGPKTHVARVRGRRGARRESCCRSG